MSNKWVPVEIEWLAIGHRTDLSWNQVTTQRYYSVKPQPGIEARLGMSGDHVIVPYALKPRDSFHKLATRDLPGRAFDDELSRLPYALHVLDNRAALITSVVSRLYPMGIQVVRVRAEICLESDDDLFGRLQSLRKPHNVRSANHVIRQAFALATGDRNLDLQQLSYRTFFGMQINVLVPKALMHDFVSNENRKELVALLIGDREVAALSDHIVERVFKNNERLNEKSAYELVLTNRNGLIYVLPKQEYRSPHSARFKRSLDLTELAMFASSFLEHASVERQRHENFLFFLLSRVELWIDAPEVVFPTSTTNQLHWGVLSDAMALRARLSQWKKTNGSGDSISSSLFQSVPKDWWSISGFADSLDRLPTGRGELDFINASQMRRFIEGDLLEARRCFASGNNKAALVMAGACVEAILLAMLEDATTIPRPAGLRRMQLGALIEEACPGWRNDPGMTMQGRLISPSLAALLDTSCRPWRNLIHPGKAIRDAVEVTDVVSRAAISALELLIEEASNANQPPTRPTALVRENGGHR
jgi:hypothetical protein